MGCHHFWPRSKGEITQEAGVSRGLLKWSEWGLFGHGLRYPPNGNFTREIIFWTTRFGGIISLMVPNSCPIQVSNTFWNKRVPILSQISLNQCCLRFWLFAHMLFFCYSLFVHGKSSDESVSIIMTVVLHPQRCRTSTSWWPRRPSHKRLVFAVVRAFFKRRLFVKSCSIASLEQVRTTSQCFWSDSIICGFIVSSLECFSCLDFRWEHHCVILELPTLPSRKSPQRAWLSWTSLSDL